MSSDSTVQRIIFTEFFRRDVAQILGCESTEAPKRRAFLNNLNWYNPKVTNAVTEAYITQVVRSINDETEVSAPDSKPVAISWGNRLLIGMIKSSAPSCVS